MATVARFTIISIANNDRKTWTTGIFDPLFDKTCPPCPPHPQQRRAQARSHLASCHSGYISAHKLATSTQPLAMSRPSCLRWNNHKMAAQAAESSHGQALDVGPAV